MISPRLILNVGTTGTWTQPTAFTPADAEGWIHLAPLGRFPGVHNEDNTRVLQVVDRAACDALVNAWRGQGSPQLLVDEDHFSHDPGKSTEALGWITELQVRDNGLWGKPRWTDQGSAAVLNGRFRFVSPVWRVTEPDNGEVRPVELTDVALTNKPNLRGLVPLTNRQQATPPKAQPEANNPGKTNMDYKALLLKKLGLDANATDEQISAACEGATTQEMETELNRCQTDIANRDLDGAGITEEADRAEIRPLLLTNRDAALKLLNRIKPAAKPAAPAPKPITNRETAKVPVVATTATVANRAAEQQKHLLEVRNRLGQSTPFQRVWDTARSEKPELYAPAQS